MLSLLRLRSIDRARLRIAEGVIAGLSFKLAATLLKTIVLQSWEQILMFAAIIVIRMLLKHLCKRSASLACRQQQWRGGSQQRRLARRHQKVQQPPPLND
jgi:uncharacterized membrane protein YfhO